LYNFRALAVAQRELLADPAHVLNFRLKEGQDASDVVVDTGSSKSNVKAVLLGGCVPQGGGPPSDKATLSAEGLVCDGGADDLLMYSEDDGEIYNLTGGHATIDTPIKFGGTFSVEVYYKHNIINPIKRYTHARRGDNDAVVFDFYNPGPGRRDSIQFLDCGGSMDLHVTNGTDKQNEIEVAEGERWNRSTSLSSRFGEGVTRYFRTEYDYTTKKTTVAREMGSDLNKWIHAVITVSGTTAKIYKNGKLIVANDDGAFSDIPLTLNGTICAEGGECKEFNGTLAYMKIWPSFDLKESDVAALYSRRNST